MHLWEAWLRLGSVHHHEAHCLCNRDPSIVRSRLVVLRFGRSHASHSRSVADLHRNGRFSTIASDAFRGSRHCFRHTYSESIPFTAATFGLSFRSTLAALCSVFGCLRPERTTRLYPHAVCATSFSYVVVGLRTRLPNTAWRAAPASAGPRFLVLSAQTAQS